MAAGDRKAAHQKKNSTSAGKYEETKKERNSKSKQIWVVDVPAKINPENGDTLKDEIGHWEKVPA